MMKPSIKSRFSDWSRNQIELAKFAWTVLIVVLGVLGYSVVPKDSPDPPRPIEVCPNKDCPYCYPNTDKTEPFEIKKKFS